MLIKKLCLNCNQEFEANSSEIKKGYGKFCCRSCAASYNNRKFPKRKSENKVKISKTVLRDEQVDKSGYFYNRIQTGSNKYVRSYMIRKHGNFCMLCGQPGDDWQGRPLTLIVDHIDGDAHNWAIENIQIICPNCDSQLSTFKGRNIGKSTRKYTITQK